MGELQRLTAYTNQRYENMVYQKKVRAAVRRVLVSPSPFFLERHFNISPPPAQAAAFFSL